MVFISIIVLSVVFYIEYFLKSKDTGLSELKFDYLIICLIHSIIPVVVLIITSLLTLKVFDTSGSWQIKNEVFFVFIVTLIVGICHFLVRGLIYNNIHNWSFQYLFDEIKNAMFVGLFVASVIVLYVQNKTFKKLKSNQPLKDASIQSVYKEKENKPNQSNTLKSQGFIYAQSFGNYMEIYNSIDGAIYKTLERITLQNLEDKYKTEPSIIRVHKSYLLNLDCIENIKGNTAGYKISIQQLPEKMIPVSRSYIDTFKNKINTSL